MNHVNQLQIYNMTHAKQNTHYYVLIVWDILYIQRSKIYSKWKKYIFTFTLLINIKQYLWYRMGCISIWIKCLIRIGNLITNKNLFIYQACYGIHSTLEDILYIEPRDRAVYVFICGTSRICKWAIYRALDTLSMHVNSPSGTTLSYKPPASSY